MARRSKSTRRSSGGGNRRYQFGAIPLCPCAGGGVSGLGGLTLGAGHEDDPYRMPGMTDRFGTDRYRSGIELPGGGEGTISPYHVPRNEGGGSSTADLLKMLAAIGVTGAAAYFLYKKFVLKTPGSSPERPAESGAVWSPQIPGIAANAPSDYVTAGA